jgi:2-polyprenyl-6-methoxyphenol hydroxylase-like FAD-dependent oxidoreductase
MTNPLAHILIIGGGIAGPALALFLKRAGFSPTIYEAHTEAADDVGAFLNLAPNGLAVLETLGLTREVRDAGHPCQRNVFYNHRGRHIGAMEFTSQPSTEGSIIIKRGRLHRLLRDAVERDGIPIHFGKRLTDIRMDAGVTATFEDGTQAYGDLLIGCDGLHSRTRHWMLPTAPAPVDTGILDFGGFAHLPTLDPSDSTHMIFGKRAFFSYFVTPHHDVYWFGNVADPNPATSPRHPKPSAAWRQELQALYAADSAPIADILQAAEDKVGMWHVYDMPSLSTWHRGAVCLVGDAAHATSPHLGQGASQALEDTIVLAKCLRDLPTAALAFARYEAMRKPRAETLVAQARRTGSQKTPPSPLMAWFRDLLMPFFLKKGAADLAWVYNYRVAWQTPI